MGVNNLWKALVKGNAVQTLEGHNPGHHALIVKAVENKVVAVDLSAWLMQAQMQPALLENYDSPYARAVKVVFDRTIHWLRYGCLPVFVIEGQTPSAKLAKLRQRCIAQYGPTARSFDVGNRAGGQFDKLGQAVKRMLDAFGVPCVQAVGEGEAMCAALNLCGWTHACHTLDVDALLFGALTVYRQVHLQTDDPRRSVLVRCDRSEVQRVLGIQRGGDAALMAVAQLAGGDYDTVGAEQVGEQLALAAVRCLLRGCEDDETVLQKLEERLQAGPDPELDALTNCTGCKACGHEGGLKSRIKQHTARHGGCAACGSSSGCVAREWSECECAFHRRADERLLNRVVHRALHTPGFLSSCRTAAATYADQLHQAIAAVQRDYGLPVAGSSRNVFTWRRRPDARAISDLMCKYIKEWDHNQVRLKLLPLLLEWDVRQGPQPQPSAGVQFRPTGIRKVSGKGAEDNSGVPARQQQGWRYVLLVERLQQQRGGASSSAPAAAAAAAAGDAPADERKEAEDLAIDLAWIAGTARSRPPKALPAASAGPAAAGTAAAAAADRLAAALDDDHDDGDVYLSSQACLSQLPPTQRTSTQRLPCSQAGLSQASQGSQAAAGSGGGRSGGSLQFSEHRSVRCSLMEAVWPEVVAAYRNPPAKSRARSGGSRKKAAAAAATAPATEEKQRSLKDFYGLVKDYTAASKPSSKPAARQPAASGGTIPGLAGIGVSSRTADCASGQPAAVAAGVAVVAAAAATARPAAAAANVADGEHSTTKQKLGQSFMDWLDAAVTEQEPNSQQRHLQPQQSQQQQSQQDVWGYGSPPSSVPGAAAAPSSTQSGAGQAADAGRAAHRVFVGIKGSGQSTSPTRPASAAAAAGRKGPPRSGGGRGRGPAKQVMQAGALERFLQPTAAPVEVSDSDCSTDKQQQTTAIQQNQQQEQQQQEQQQEQQHEGEGQQQQPSPAPSPLKRAAATIDCCSDSPEVLPLAARLQARSKLGAGAAAAAAGAAAAAAEMPPPAKKASMDRVKDLLDSPLGQGQECMADAAAGAASAVQRPRFTAQYAALLEEVGALSPVPCKQQCSSTTSSSKSVKGLFGALHSAPQQQQQQQQHLLQQPVIELLDSPDPGAASLQQQHMLAASKTVEDNNDVVDLT